MTEKPYRVLKYLAHKARNSLEAQRWSLVQKLRTIPNHEWQEQGKIKMQIDEVEESLVKLSHIA